MPDLVGLLFWSWARWSPWWTCRKRVCVTCFDYRVTTDTETWLLKSAMKTLGLLDLCGTPVAKIFDAPFLFWAPSDANVSGLMSECFDLSRNSTLFFPLCLILLPSVISTSGQDLQCVSVRVTLTKLTKACQMSFLCKCGKLILNNWEVLRSGLG